MHFAAAKQHLGFYPTPSAIQRFSKELRPFKTSKGAIQFPYTQELPLSLIQEIVKFRVQENMKSVGQNHFEFLSHAQTDKRREQKQLLRK